MFRFLGHLYAAEALISLDRISDAIAHLNPENVSDVSMGVLTSEQDQGKSPSPQLLKPRSFISSLMWYLFSQDLTKETSPLSRVSPRCSVAMYLLRATMPAELRPIPCFSNSFAFFKIVFCFVCLCKSGKQTPMFYPSSVTSARAMMLFNLGSAYCLRSEYEKARKCLNQVGVVTQSIAFCSSGHLHPFRHKDLLC